MFTISFGPETYEYLVTNPSTTETYGFIVFRLSINPPRWGVDFVGNHAEMDAAQFQHFLKKKGFSSELSVSSELPNSCPFCT